MIFLNMHALKLFSQKNFPSPRRQSNPIFVAWVFVAQWLQRLTGDQKVIWIRFPSGTQKVFLREQLKSVRIKNIITKLPQTHHFFVLLPNEDLTFNEYLPFIVGFS